MWIKVFVFILAAAIILLLLKIYFERQNDRKNGTPANELEELTTPQLKEQFETFKRLRNTLSDDFIIKSSEEQQKTVERLKNIDEKLERMRDILAERGEFAFIKNNTSDS